MIYEIIGWGGGILILVAYFLVSTGKIPANSKEYQILNIIGALGIIINSAIHSALPSAGLNIIWLCIGLYGLIKIVRSNHDSS